MSESVVIPEHDSRNFTSVPMSSDSELEYIRTCRTADARNEAGLVLIESRMPVMLGTSSKSRTLYKRGSSLSSFVDDRAYMRRSQDLPDTDAMSDENKRWDYGAILGGGLEYKPLEFHGKLCSSAHRCSEW
jgi:hypothetical protein